MDFIKDTFRRTDLRQIRQFILQGTEELAVDNRSYRDRLTAGSNPIYNRLKEIYPKQADFDKAAAELSTALTAYEGVYTEIGMKAGARLIFQLLLTDDQPPTDTDSKGGGKNG